jgi:hypothetical protein
MKTRRSPGTLSMLAISTILALLAVAIIWAMFAGPLERAPLKPQVN